MAIGIRKRDSFEYGDLGASLSNSATTITFAAAPGFATLGANEYLPIMLPNGQEVVHLTSYTAGNTTGTIERGMEGTSATTHASGDPWLHGPTPLDAGSVWVNTLNPAGASVTLDWALGNDAVIHNVVMDQNCSINLATLPSSGTLGTMTIKISGAFTPTLDAGMDFGAAGAPTYEDALILELVVFDGTNAHAASVGGGFA